MCVESTSAVFFLFFTAVLQEIFIDKNCLLRTFFRSSFRFFFFFFWRGFSASKSRWDLKSFTPKLGKFLWCFFFASFFVLFGKQFNRFSIFYQLESEGPCRKIQENYSSFPGFCVWFRILELELDLIIIVWRIKLQ